MHWTIDKYNFMYFPPVPQGNNFHSSEGTIPELENYQLRHSLAEDFSGLERGKRLWKARRAVGRGKL